jgi:Cd2+-exporting ATPase
VHCGTSDVDESAVTGESLPVTKAEGSNVVAGTLNLGGTLDIKVTRLAHENSLSTIARLVEEAQSSRAPIQDIADRIASYIIPTTLVIASVTFFCWVLINHFVRHRRASSSSLDALTYAIAVLVIACPRAIGLAIPTVVSVSMRTAARYGILFKSVEASQVARSVDTVIFDKTGTITTGNLCVKMVELLRNTIVIVDCHKHSIPCRRDSVEELVHALLEGNKHPIAKGVVAHIGSEADADLLSLLAPIRIIPGKGTEASFFGLKVRGGSAEFTGASHRSVHGRIRAEYLLCFTGWNAPGRLWSI